MGVFLKASLLIFAINYAIDCESAKINTPRVLLPWFEDLHVNFTFEIIEGGCYTWSLSRDDIIDLEPLFDSTWGHCSRAARVSVSKACVPPGSVIILAEEVNTGEILRGDVDIDTIKSIKVMSTTWRIYLEEAPEAFEVVAYDDQGNTFSTLEGISFDWSIENIGNDIDDQLVTLVRWKDTDYEAPKGVTELESKGKRSYNVLLYGQGMGEARVTVCQRHICTDFTLHVVASVVLTPATALLVPGDTIRYRVVRARAGRLTVQNIADTLYSLKIPEDNVANIEDSISLVRGTNLGSTNVLLMTGSTEVASAILTVAEPYSIRVNLRPSSLIIRDDAFIIHCIVYDESGHAFTAGDDILIRLTVQGEANVELLSSTTNGTLTEAIAHNSGPFTVFAKLHSIAGRQVYRKVEGQISAVAVDPLEIVPPELFVAWTDTIQEIQLQHRGGGGERVTWSESERDGTHALSVSPTGAVTVRGVGEIGVQAHLFKYPHVMAYGNVWSAVGEWMQVSSTGQVRVGRPHHIHVALTGTHPHTGELYNFHRCNCGSFAVSVLEGPEPVNITAATWVQPAEGACCVLEAVWGVRGAAVVRVSRGRVSDSLRVVIRARPALLWPEGNVAALVSAQLPVIAVGEALVPQSSETRTVELSERDGAPPHKHPDAQLFTIKCRRKGDSHLTLVSDVGDERESAEWESWCAGHVSRARIEPPPSNNCTHGNKLWLRTSDSVKVKVTIFDAIGRELFDERGPKVTWDISPKHYGIEYGSQDRLYVETHPEFEPVPVPFSYYQLISADESAIGWSGTIKASIPETTVSIQAKVVAPLHCEPNKVRIAWEGETVVNITSISGGSGQYSVETPKGVTATVLEGNLNAIVPGPGSYDLLVTDQCIAEEKHMVEMEMEEIGSVEVVTSHAVCVGACIPIKAVVRGRSHRPLRSSPAVWTVSSSAIVHQGTLCGLAEGTATVRASVGGISSSEVEVLVFPPLAIVPAGARLPPSGRLQLLHSGGPPSHLATLQYQLIDGANYVDVSESGLVNGLSIGKARVRLTARDIMDVEMARAESVIEIVPVSNVRVRSATQTLLVGAPNPLWLEAEGGLGPSALSALHPSPRVTWTIRDSTSATLYTTHADDRIERSVAEGLTVRVVPLKPGVITVDVRARNMGQLADTKSMDTTIEILAISDIRTSIESVLSDINHGDRIALATGAAVRLRSNPRSSWKSYDKDGVFSINGNGELVALKPGFGVVVAQNNDERNNIYRETMLHVEVSLPHYCTLEPSSEEDESTVRVVVRNAVGRELIAPAANITAYPPLLMQPAKTTTYSNVNNELVVTGVGPSGAMMQVGAYVSGLPLRDEVWLTGTDQSVNRIIASGSSVICVSGGGWVGPSTVTLVDGGAVTVAVLTTDAPARHVLTADRPPRTVSLLQTVVDKWSFKSGEWGWRKVPLSWSQGGVHCSEHQRLEAAGLEIPLPFTCRAHQPHTALPYLDIVNGEIGCTIIPAIQITKPIDVELCAEWGYHRTCTKVPLLPEITIAPTSISLNSPPAQFTIIGYKRALEAIKLTIAPGLKIESQFVDQDLVVTVKSEVATCGLGWVNVHSKLTGQDVRIEVERDCDLSCGTVLEALFSLVKPYFSMLFTIACVITGYAYVQKQLAQKKPINLPQQPSQTVLPPAEGSPLNRSRWSRSPYQHTAMTSPVYGDSSSLMSDNSYPPSPNRTSLHSRFL